jgi:hypothetical protein
MLTTLDDLVLAVGEIYGSQDPPKAFRILRGVQRVLLGQDLKAATAGDSGCDHRF